MTKRLGPAARTFPGALALWAVLIAAAPSALAMGETAAAAMKGADGADLGTVTLTESMSGVLLRVELKGVTPGPHGFHVHGVGKCEGDFASAGPIYNPFGAQHGFLNPEGPMPGDLPNVFATASGEIAAEMTSSSSVTLSKTADDAVIDADGAALVIFESADDHLTDPEGNAGKRIACGVIEAK